MITRRSAGRVGQELAIGLVAVLSSTAVFVPANAQQQASPDPAKQARSSASAPSQKDDVVVTARIDADPPSTVPVTARGETMVSDRIASSEAHRFVRCAKRADPGLIRQAIEGLPHRYDSEYALDRIVREEQACYSGLPTSAPMPSSPYYGSCNPMIATGGSVCRAFFDRGALIERALSKATPALSLSDGDLSDPAVIERFNARNATLNSTRYSYERIGYAVVACMVATHTTDAMGLIHSEPGSGSERRLAAILLGQSPRCLGGAKRISTDTAQFRVYVAETIYFFAAALRGVTSLIPDDAKRG